MSVTLNKTEYMVNDPDILYTDGTFINKVKFCYLGSIIELTDHVIWI